MKHIQQQILLVLFVALPFFADSQISGLVTSALTEKSNRLQGKITGETYYISSQENNYHFLQKDWVQGNILLEDGIWVENIKIRYKAFDDKLVAYNEANKLLFIVDKPIVKEFHFSNNGVALKFVKLYQDGLFPDYHYFEEMYKGKNTLLAFRHIDEVKVSPYLDSQGIMRDTQFRPDVSYYFYSLEGKFLKLNFRKKAFYNLAPENKKEIRKVLRKNRTIIFDETTLLQAFKLLDNEGLLN